ncbi:hypothetical protein LSAT2_023433 [Lamellibrachia satsuma]|nr:hypothetical protein LSAT2_023433 [Lamellibrachia satsuma]
MRVDPVRRSPKSDPRSGQGKIPEAERPNPRKAANFRFACMIVAGITFFITGVTLVALAGQRDPFDSKTRVTDDRPCFPIDCYWNSEAFLQRPACSQPQPVVSGAASTGLVYPLST